MSDANEEKQADTVRVSITFDVETVERANRVRRTAKGRIPALSKVLRDATVQGLDALEKGVTR